MRGFLVHLYDLFTESELDDQIGKKMVKRQFHPSASLAILNYTQMATFNPEHWNHVTDKCRGIIYHVGTLEVVARPFQKFWNINDTRRPETMMGALPANSPVLTRKMDGSLGIGYYADGGWSIATRGSFASEQAITASRWVEDWNADAWPDGWTPLFEVIYPENQIVVRYDYSGLVLLAMVNNETGEEMPRHALLSYGCANGVRVVDSFNHSLSACLEEDEANEEGYVASWHRDGQIPLRVKIKYETYCRLHKLLTQTSAIGVWEMLRDGQDVVSLTVDVPSEFSTWIRGIETRLRADYKEIEDAALAAMLEYDGEKNISNPEEKKAFALYALTKGPLTPILFAMVSGKEYAGIIWKMLRPRGDEKVFRKDDE